MDSLFYSFAGSNSWAFSAIINGLIDKDGSYNIIYDAIIKHPSYVILSDGEASHKIKVIDKIINHYEQKEEYEKCAALLNIKNSIL